MNTKNIYDYSDPIKVQSMAHKYLGKDVDVYFSTRKKKKYMVQNPEGEWVHFGEYPYEDFTKHEDDKRRDNFRKRNAKWKDSPKWSPSWLSWHLLW